MTLKLNVKKSQAPDAKRKVTQCPECGFKGIEWRMTGEFLMHSYVCPECGYEGAIMLEATEG